MGSTVRFFFVMDHYKTLGLRRNATKDEIKEAFRRLALKFHPDRHLQSSKEVRDGATIKFRQVSEAYEVLIDDQKRVDYLSRRRSYNAGSGFYGSGYDYSRNSYRQRSGSGSGSGYENSRSTVFNLDIAFRFLTTRAFLLNVAFVGFIFGGAIAIQRSGEAIWNMHNSGEKKSKVPRPLRAPD